ncbi:TPA: hypothetical protein ACIX47_004693, partial [Escherichia coli]
MTGNEPEQQPRGLTANQNLNHPGVIPGSVLHHLPPIPESVLRDLHNYPTQCFIARRRYLPGARPCA